MFFNTFFFLNFVLLFEILFKIRFHCETINVPPVVESLQHSGRSQQIVLRKQRVQAIDDHATIAVRQLEAFAQQVNDQIFGQHSAHVAVVVTV